VAGQGWQAIGLPSGVSGTVRVMLLPWNCFILDIAVTATVGSATTYTLGNLPSNCQPSNGPGGVRIYALGTNETVNTSANTALPRIYMTTAGGLQLIFPAGSAGTSTATATLIIPTN
jgi:hypothetical protein